MGKEKVDMKQVRCNKKHKSFGKRLIMIVCRQYYSWPGSTQVLFSLLWVQAKSIALGSLNGKE
jgi:hypothetical protein